jgi:hypothetical protein
MLVSLANERTTLTDPLESTSGGSNALCGRRVLARERRPV